MEQTSPRTKQATRFIQPHAKLSFHQSSQSPVEPLRQVDEGLLENVCSTDAAHYRTWEGIDPGNPSRCRTQSQPGQRPQHLEHEDLERAKSPRGERSSNLQCDLVLFSVAHPFIHHASISTSTTKFIEQFTLMELSDSHSVGAF
jgi:hypothetical protein